jgi:hypothetical protein
MSDTDDQAGDAPQEGEILKANSFGPDQIHVGMDVVSIDGQPVGKVNEVRTEDFLLDRPMARGLYVPYRFVLATEDYGGKFRGGRVEPTDVVLIVGGAQLDKQGWKHA